MGLERNSILTDVIRHTGAGIQWFETGRVLLLMIVDNVTTFFVKKSGAIPKTPILCPEIAAWDWLCSCECYVMSS